jgi:hypothetical protein
MVHVAEHSLPHFKCRYFESIYRFGKIAGLVNSLLSVQAASSRFRIVSLLCALPSKVWIPYYVFSSFFGFYSSF